MRAYLLSLLLPLLGAPALARQADHSHHHATPGSPSIATPAQAAPSSDPHAGHDMSSMGQGSAETSTAIPAEMEGPPAAAQQTLVLPPPTDHLADKLFDPAAMARARQVLRNEHGGAQISQVMASLLERQVRSGPDGYRWEGEAWFGGDIHRLVVKTEGEGDRHGVEIGEAQLLYSRAIAPYTDLQLGVRQDVEPKARTYATLGFETLLPYWVEANGAVFLSNKGDLLARVEGAYDLRLTQRLILQPRAELDFAAQDVVETGTGSGLSRAELGLRLRYEIRREWAPYVGVSYERAVGRTADFARDAGGKVAATSVVFGVRAWF